MNTNTKIPGFTLTEKEKQKIVGTLKESVIGDLSANQTSAHPTERVKETEWKERTQVRQEIQQHEKTELKDT